MNGMTEQELGDSMESGLRIPGKLGTAEQLKTRQWSVRFVLWFLMLCGLVLGINVIVDPYGIYGTRWIQPVVWSDRREKLDLLRNHTEATDLLVLGSSRMMRVSPADLREMTGLEGFNLAVNHARTEDFLALLRYSVLNLGLRPRIVLVGLDIHAFRGFYQADNLIEYYPELAYYISSEKRNRLIYSFSVKWNKITRGLSYHQLGMSVSALHRFLRQGAWQNSYRFAVDGTLTFNSSEDQNTPSQRHSVDAWLDEAVERYVRDFRSFGGISETRIEYFNRLALFCRQWNIQLVGVLLPYQPQFLERLKGSEFDHLNGIWKNRMEELLAGEKVRLVDARDIAVFEGDPSQFYDEIHMMPSNSTRLARFVANHAGLEVRHTF